MSTEASNADMLLGMIVAYAGSRKSLTEKYGNSGWVLCEGQLAKTGPNPANKKLFEVIGNSWCKDNSCDADTFQLPDLRGQFLRGVSSTIEQDPDREARSCASDSQAKEDLVGSTQPYAVHQHSHTFNSTSGGHPHLTDNYAIELSLGHRDGENTGLKIVNDIGPIVKPYTRQPDAHVSSETRPRNAYVYYLIYVGRGFECL